MKKYSYKEIIKIIKEKNFKKIVTFGQSRGGTTISSYILAYELKYLNYFVPEEISNNLNIKRMFIELVKNKKIFIHHHHNVYKRHLLNNSNTIFIFIYRSDKEIKKSFLKSKNRLNNIDWTKDIINRVLKKKNIKTKNPPKYLNDLWNEQAKCFDNAYTMNYSSFKNHKFFVKSNKRNKLFKNIKQIGVKKKHKFKDNLQLKRYFNEKGFRYLKLIFLFLFYKFISYFR